MLLRFIAILLLAIGGTATVKAQFPMTNGITYQGGIATPGNSQTWNFNAISNQSIVIRVGTIKATNGFEPEITLYNPNAARQAQLAGSVAAEIAVTATNTGTFSLVVSGVGGFGTGAYLLVLAQIGMPVTISPGQEGGLLTGFGSYAGNISVGGLDEWQFTACTGAPISLQMAVAATNTTTLVPWIRLYDRSGILMNSVSGNPSAVNTTAPTNGLYTIVLTDNSSGYGGSGGYVFTVNGLSSGLKLCDPIITSPSSINVSGIGGVTNGTYEILSSTNVTTFLSLWTPLETNSFDAFGTFTITNLFNAADAQRYFIIEEP